MKVGESNDIIFLHKLHVCETEIGHDKRHPCCPFALCIIYYIEIPQDEGIYVLSNFGCLNKSWVYMKTGLVDQNFRIGQIYLGAKTWSWQLGSDSGGS